MQLRKQKVVEQNIWLKLIILNSKMAIAYKDSTLVNYIEAASGFIQDALLENESYFFIVFYVVEFDNNQCNH